MPMITKKLISKVLDNYPLSIDGIHGISHWARVRENGLRLAELTDAHKSVVELFALFHDSQRINDGKDWKHGLRGAQFAKTLKGSFFHLPENLFDLLHTACEKHTSDPTHEDITIQTCFDADRLDLGRVGITPDPANVSDSLNATVSGTYYDPDGDDTTLFYKWLINICIEDSNQS